MKQSATISQEQEPVGIVISCGSSVEHPPVVWAYVWGPAPEPVVAVAEPKAA